jgi:hypothetical protein
MGMRAQWQALSNYDHRQFEQLKPVFDYTAQ